MYRIMYQFVDIMQYIYIHTYPHYLRIISMAANGSAFKNVSTNQFFATQAVPLKTFAQLPAAPKATHLTGGGSIEAIHHCCALVYIVHVISYYIILYYIYCMCMYNGYRMWMCMRDYLK